MTSGWDGTGFGSVEVVRTPRAQLPVLALLLALLLGACLGSRTAGAEPEPSSSAYFDCEAVADARQALDRASSTELERLGLTPADPQSLTVTLVTGSVGAPAYWAAVRDAATGDAPASLRTDLDTLAGYWAELSDELATIELPDAAPGTLTAAGQQLATVSASAADPRVAPAQRRVEEALGLSCG